MDGQKIKRDLVMTYFTSQRKEKSKQGEMLLMSLKSACHRDEASTHG